MPQGSPRVISANLNTAAEDGPTLHTFIRPQPGGLQTSITPGFPENAALLSGPDDALLDVGWNTNREENARVLVDGICNDDLWLLVRRFNKQIFHIKATSEIPPGGLDFNVSEEEEFSPNKLRAQLERLYMGLLLGSLGLVDHLARLHSWREPRRTALFGLVYLLAWTFDYLVPILIITSTAIAISPSARRTLFPPYPLSLVDYRTGGLKKPSAGVLASTTSVTGAPENIKGEAVENEASNFVTGITAIAMNTLIDKDPQHNEDQEGGGITSDFPEPNVLATKVAVAKDNAAGVDKPSQDKSKFPMEQIMWSKMRPLMHGICVLSDIYDRCKNLLNPPPPFSRATSRLRLLGVLFPVLALSTFLTCYMVYKVATLAVGLNLFGDPILRRVYNCLHLNNLTISDTILNGIPTDAQLTISLLRLGEVKRTPIPPPPHPQRAPSQAPNALDESILSSVAGDKPLGATEEEIHSAADRNTEMLSQAGGGDREITGTGGQGKFRERILRVVKRGAKTAAKALVAIDSMRAKAGSDSAKTRLGATSLPGEPAIAGPVEFEARYNGEKGYLYLSTDSGSPFICFSTKAAKENVGTQEGVQKLQHAWAVPISEIKDLNKYSGYGAKSKLAAGWALETRIMDGLEIVDKQGDAKLVTAVPRRDDVFNRLCAMGSQNWEVW